MYFLRNHVFLYFRKHSNVNIQMKQLIEKNILKNNIFVVKYTIEVYISHVQYN